MPNRPLPNSFDESAAPAVNAWVLGLIDFGNRRSRRWSGGVVAGLILFVGGIDYLTGTKVSLTVFYLLPIILSALWLGWRAGCVVSVVSIVARVGGDMVHQGDSGADIGVFWTRFGHLALYLVLVGLLHALISLQRQLELRVQQRTAALEQALRARDELQRQLFDTGQRERSNIGHELHDGLGQHLTATSLAAKMLSSELESGGHPAAPEARNIVRMTQDAIAQTRQLARGLLLAAIEPGELVSELEELCGNLQRESGIKCRFSLTGTPRKLDVERASHLFYIAQEAARNALRHARPSRIEISLRCHGEELELSVTDNGVGPPGPEAHPTGMGIRIMAHRSELIGGQFAIAANPTGGTRVTCEVSLAPVPTSV